GGIAEYLVAERLQAAGFETYVSLDVPGIDILGKRGPTEITVQVKYANHLHGHRWKIGGGHGYPEHLRRANWLVAVLPDFRMYIIPKKLLKPGKSYVNF